GQARQLRARPPDANDLELAGAVRAGRVQIQNDFTRFNPEEMTAAHVGGNGKNVDMSGLDRQHPLAIIEQPRMARVEQHLLMPAMRSRLPRGFAAGRTVAHSVISSLA